MLTQKSRFIHQVPAHLQAVLTAAMDRFQLDDLSDHGPAHWLTVFRHATELAGKTPGADMDICQHFALMHDCERCDEGTDPKHGPRAAAFARQMHLAGSLSLCDEQIVVLCEACEHHADGEVSIDPTIGVCWDADRLDLPRVGIGIDKRFLSTAAAKSMTFARSW